MEHLNHDCLNADFREMLLMSAGALTISLGVIFALVGMPL
jgi:hypothetical protein